jgi:hypothetical protein
MPGSTGDEERERKRAAVQRELERERAPDEADDNDDLVGTVGDEQRREREAVEDGED